MQTSAKAAEQVDTEGLEEQSVIGPQHSTGVTVGLVAPHAHAPCPQGELAVNLVKSMPARPLHGGADELVTDVAFGEFCFVQAEARQGGWG